VQRWSLDEHQQQCLQRAAEDTRRGVEATRTARKQLRSDGLLTDKQFAALQHVEKTAQQASDAARSSLLQRVEQQGFDECGLHKAERYFREHAQLIIHVNLDTPGLLQSDNYRCLFETHTSNVSGHSWWFFASFFCWLRQDSRHLLLTSLRSAGQLRPIRPSNCRGSHVWRSISCRKHAARRAC